MELVTSLDEAVREVVILSDGKLSRKTVEKCIPLEIDSTDPPVRGPVAMNEPTADQGMGWEETEDIVEHENPVDLAVRPKRRTAAAEDAHRKELVRQDLI